jgi:hypothetical protein
VISRRETLESLVDGGVRDLQRRRQEMSIAGGVLETDLHISELAILLADLDQSGRGAPCRGEAVRATGEGQWLHTSPAEPLWSSNEARPTCSATSTAGP